MAHVAEIWAHYSPERGWCWSSRNKRVAELMWEGDPVICVIVHEDPGGDHWAWWDNEAQGFDYLFKNLKMLQACFANGPEAEEKRGRGQLLVVSVHRKEEEKI